MEAQIRHTEPLVKFIGVDKSYYGRTLAVRALTLDVAQGEFLTLPGLLRFRQDHDAEHACRL